MIQNQRTVSCVKVDRQTYRGCSSLSQVSFIFVGLLSPLYRKLRHLRRLFSKDFPWENSNKFLSWIWGRTASFSEVGGGSVNGRFTGESLGPRGAPGCYISSCSSLLLLDSSSFQRERKEDLSSGEDLYKSRHAAPYADALSCLAPQFYKSESKPDILLCMKSRPD